MSEPKKTAKVSGMSFSLLLTRAFGIILVLTVVASGISLVGLNNTVTSYSDFLEKDNTGLSIANDLKIDMLQARRAEKDFMLRAEIPKLDDVYDLADNISLKADDIKDLDLSKEINALCDSIKAKIVIYDDTFDEVANDMIARGGGVFGADNGLVGSYRDEVHAVDALNAGLYAGGDINETIYYRLDSLYLDMRKNEKDYLLRHNDPTANVTGYIAAIPSLITEYKSIINDPTVTVGLGTLNTTVKGVFTTNLDGYQADFTAVVVMDEDIATGTATFRDATHDVEVFVDDIEIEVEALIAEKIIQINAAANLTMLTSLVLLVAVLIASVVLIVILTRSLNKPIREIDEDVAFLSSGDLTTELKFSKKPAKELQRLGYNFQSMKESLRYLIRSVSETAERLTTSSEEFASSAEELNASSEEISSVIQQMNRGAQQQAEQINSTVTNVQDLSDASDKIIQDITSTVSLITDVAAQTNMLALNAAIEAARAGDYGRGFAVVADNVRRLAEDTKQNTSNIQELITTIQHQITLNVDRIAKSVDSVAAVAEETAASSEEASAASEEQTATMEEMSAAAQELAQLAEELSSSISQFKLEDDERGKRTVTRTALVTQAPRTGFVEKTQKATQKAFKPIVDKITKDKEKSELLEPKK